MKRKNNLLPKGAKLSTYGDFVNKLRELNCEGSFFVSQWLKDIGGEEALEDYVSIALTLEPVLQFAETMTEYYRRRLVTISSEDLFKSTFDEGKELLEEIQKVAEGLGVEVPVPLSEMPITITEIMAASGHIELDRETMTVRPKPQDPPENP